MHGLLVTIESSAKYTVPVNPLTLCLHWKYPFLFCLFYKTLNNPLTLCLHWKYPFLLWLFYKTLNIADIFFSIIYEVISTAYFQATSTKFLPPRGSSRHSVYYRNIVGFMYLITWFVLDWLPSNWCMNQHKSDLIFFKILSFGISFSLIWLNFWLVGMIYIEK